MQTLDLHAYTTLHAYVGVQGDGGLVRAVATLAVHMVSESVAGAVVLDAGTMRVQAVAAGTLAHLCRFEAARWGRPARAGGPRRPPRARPRGPGGGGGGGGGGGPPPGPGRFSA